jgi:hypothetical protein
MVLGVLPDDFDRVQLRTIGWEMEQNQTMLDQPFVQLFSVDVVVDAGIVQHHHRQWHPLFTPGNTVDQIDDRRAFDRLAVKIIPELAAGIVQRTDHVHALFGNAGVRRVWDALGRPRPLHVRNVGEPAFIQVKQADLALSGGVLKLFQVFLSGREAFRVAFFLKTGASA